MGKQASMFGVPVPRDDFTMRPFSSDPMKSETKMYLDTVGMNRPPEPIGMFHGKAVWLSIQAGPMAYCKPKKVLQRITEYSRVEVGLIADGRLVRPIELGLAEIDGLWKHKPPVAPMLSWDQVAQIRRTLLAHAQPMPDTLPIVKMR